jgi:hypothetical protein
MLDNGAQLSLPTTNDRLISAPALHTSIRFEKYQKQFAKQQPRSRKLLFRDKKIFASA